MEHNGIIDLILFGSLFLIATGILQIITRSVSFPYTVALLIAGFIAQFFVHFSGLDPHISLSPDLIFYILLPILLFEAALHINIHQFKLQFKTISFFATFGLLVSIGVIAGVIALLIGLPFEVALLFGAIISATDPIAVLALFKSLGAPKRLALVADGESMFNDATAVIAFRVISAFVITNASFKPVTLLDSMSEFLYVFFGSLVVGVVIGYIASYIFSRMKEERVLITALATGLALGTFVGVEHFFHLSGVITVVIAGVTIGNFGRTKIPVGVMHFMEELWEYFGFISLSLVFFFASFNLDLGLFGGQIRNLIIVVAAVLLGRAVSVYLTAFLSNRLRFFNNEPNIPMSWQHILNWGGLRGVIPLVLVYSLPDEFAYKELMLQYTFAALLFTLFVNGLTIKSLLIKLGLHLPRREEQIIEDEKSLFEVEEIRRKLRLLSKREFDQNIIRTIDKELEAKEAKWKEDLSKHATPQEFLLSLKLEAIDIERTRLRELFEEGRFSETVFHSFDAELDLQQDALEYPEMFGTRAVTKKGMVNTGRSFRKRLIQLRMFATQYSWLSKLLGVTDESLVNDRYGLLRARLFTSYAVLEYLDRVGKILPKKQLKKAIDEVCKVQQSYITKNESEVKEIAKKYPHVVEDYQRRIINALIAA